MQEESLLADSSLRCSITGLPGYGIAELRWNESLLVEGVLAIESAVLVMAGGILLEISSQSRPDPVNLNIPGATWVPVFLHVGRPYENDERFEGKTLVDKNGIACWDWPVVLSTEQEHSTSHATMRLAEFSKAPDGQWTLASRYIPPLMQIGTSPFLQTEFNTFSQQLEAYHYQLTQEMSAIYLSGENLINAKLCLKSVVTVLRLVTNLRNQIHLHPYLVYEELLRFYVDLCFYRNITPQYATEAYRHEQLAECFRQIFDPLKELLQLTQSRSPYLPFTRSEGIIRVNVGSDIREAREVFLLLQKTGVTQVVHLDNIKIAAVSRIPMVHKFALQGISIKRIDRPPFQHSFGPEVDIYQLNLSEEWDYAVKEQGLGFYAEPAFEQIKFFLYWRNK